MNAPGLSWDAMLEITNSKHDLIPDLEMYIFFEISTRSQISYISNRHSKANNNYSKSYDTKEELKHTIYLDANNLYGYVMPKFLPIR